MPCQGQEGLEVNVTAGFPKQKWECPGNVLCIKALNMKCSVDWIHGVLDHWVVLDFVWRLLEFLSLYINLVCVPVSVRPFPNFYFILDLLQPHVSISLTWGFLGGDVGKHYSSNKLMASLHPCTCISKCGPEVNPLAVVHVVAAYVILWCRKKPFAYYKP